jgi:tetratricopeptide (TPR) repeat protein
MTAERLRHLTSTLPYLPLILLLAGCAGSHTVRAQHGETTGAPHGETTGAPHDEVHAQPSGGGVPLYDNLGNHHYRISTAVPLAQRYFDQGLRLYYAFNHGEAIRAFDEAARLDPTCAMCYWGTALAFGPNINMPMDSASGAAAYAATRQALALRQHATAMEQALIDAVATRYSAVPHQDRASLDSAYARAMRQVAARFPGDPEAGTLYAEALMDLSPWNYWNRDGSPRPDTQELLASLEKVLAAHPEHPGANHFFIHAVEAVDPQRALPMAERLAGLMPGAGHLVHMPGHIYVRVGRYLDAIRANEHAVHADESYIRDHNPALGVYTLGYYPHNYDFLAFAASMIGRSRQSLEAADRMAALVPRDMLREPGLTLLQSHLSRALQLRVRFGRWEEILQAPAPDEDLHYARGIWHYARGRALAATGDPAAATTELAHLRALAGHPDLDGAHVEFNPAPALLSLAADVLAGHAAAAAREYDAAIRFLRSAAEHEDNLVYGEPPEWSVPVRQELGVILLQAGRAAESESVYREDLARFPDNGWSLDGLARSLSAQGRTTEAAAARETFQRIWSTADVRITDRGVSPAR